MDQWEVANGLSANEPGRETSRHHARDIPLPDSPDGLSTPGSQTSTESESESE